MLGYPSNYFGKQEHGSSKEITTFCFNTYGMKFRMFSKTEVAGPNKNAFYAAVVKAMDEAPKWNFHKYLISPDGKVVSSFARNATPQNPNLLSELERVLK